jgi:hypothetical protein
MGAPGNAGGFLDDPGDEPGTESRQDGIGANPEYFNPEDWLF